MRAMPASTGHDQRHDVFLYRLAHMHVLHLAARSEVLFLADEQGHQQAVNQMLLADDPSLQMLVQLAEG